jgi:hypothetical protein
VVKSVPEAHIARMVRTRGMTPCATFDCLYCAAVYAVRYSHLPTAIARVRIAKSVVEK